MLFFEDNSNTILDIFNDIKSIEIFENDKQIKIEKHNPNYKKILNNLFDTFEDSRLSPAFGVSIHEETIKVMQKDSWIKLNFSKEMKKNELPFNSLVFKLEETYGFNLIRFYNQKYDGRCIYIDFIEKINLKNILNGINF